MSYQRLYEHENKLIRNYDYKNNNLLNSQEYRFSFIDGKFYWKELMKINTKYIERSSDVSLLYPYIPNILYTKLNLDNIDLLSEEYIIQLVTLLQLTGQYLILSQKILEEENNELKAIIRNLKNNIEENEKYQRIIDNLNRKNQENEFLIKTYQDMAQNNIYENNMTDDDNKNINLKSVPQINYVQKTYYYCNICLGKKFKTQKYLDEHMKRRHYNQKEFNYNKKEVEEQKVEEDNYRLEFEERLNTMKTEYINLIKQKEENNEFAILNKKLDLLQTQIISQNYNNAVNYRSNSNYYNKNKYNKVFLNIEKKDILQNELNQKYNDLKKKYNDLLAKFEEKNKLQIDLKGKSTYIEEKDIKYKKINKFENKIINIDNRKINVEIKAIKNKKDISIDKNKIEKGVEIEYINKKIDTNIINNFANDKKIEEYNKKGLKIMNNNQDKIILNNKINLNNIIENEKKKKFFTNDGNETFIDEHNNKNEQKKEETKNSINSKVINDIKKQDNNINEDLEKSKNNVNDSDKNEENNIKIKNKLKESSQDIKSDNNEIKNIPLIETNDEQEKLKIFYKQYKNRDKNCLNEKINDYKKIELVEEPSIELKEILEGKEYSEEFIKNYKNYDYLDKELGLKELLESYKKLKKDKNQNQGIDKNASLENSNIGKQSRVLKTSISNNIIGENPYKLNIPKKNEVIESSFIKGFDLVKSTK